MKSLTLLFIAIFLTASAMAQTLTKEERKAAIKYIKWTNKELKKSLKGLSTAQLNYKSTPDRWSPQECLYHIAFSEGALRGALDQALQAPADPAAKAELKMTDEQIKTMITDRSSKIKTMEPFEPQNTGFKTMEEAAVAFKSKRAMLMELVKNSNADMRNHIVILPFGKMDAYQFILFIAGHTNRHTQQLNEVKTTAGYPQS